jgi:hypothetical protein
VYTIPPEIETALSLTNTGDKKLPVVTIDTSERKGEASSIKELRRKKDPTKHRGDFIKKERMHIVRFVVVHCSALTLAPTPVAVTFACPLSLVTQTACVTQPLNVNAQSS